jgi:hypothetical protein
MAKIKVPSPLNVAVGAITKEDALNLLRIMDRAEYKGLGEASVAVILRHKLTAIAEATDGEDVPSSD